MTRAIAQRMQAEGVTTWEQALAFAHRFWDAQGWLQLGLWQMKACYRVGEELVLLPRAKAAASREADLRHHRAERRRLQAEASEVQEELRTLRPLKDKVERLSEEAERLRLRDAELVHARDRALARVEALETANAELDRARKAAILRLAALAPDPAPAPDPRAIREVVYADELELPAAADSLRVLGARTIRAFCVHKGNLGPETFPPGALVILDIRFVGHSQSSVIADRAERSGARYLAVRSGKGSLARTVATALEEKRLGGG